MFKAVNMSILVVSQRVDSWMTELHCIEMELNSSSEEDLDCFVT